MKWDHITGTNKECLRISVCAEDGTLLGECTTVTFIEYAAGCEIMTPRGATVTASISDDQIPDGYELFVEVPAWDMPEEGERGLATYILLGGVSALLVAGAGYASTLRTR